MARWKLYIAGPPGRREEDSRVVSMDLPFEWGTAGSAVAYHAAKRLAARGERVHEDRILALPDRPHRPDPLRHEKRRRRANVARPHATAKRKRSSRGSRRAGRRSRRSR